MGMDETQIEFPKSFINNGLSNFMMAADRGHILVGFPIREIDVDRRRRVKDAYKSGDYTAKFADYIVVAEIIGSNGDYLIVPPLYGKCSYEQQSSPKQRPPDNHKNNPVVMSMIDAADGARNA